MARPCENCPYRMDAPRRLWHRSEFVKLLESDENLLGSTYACHKQGEMPASARGLCAGWLLDQKRRHVPSIALRMLLMTNEAARAAFEAVSAEGLEMFRTVKAMCRANGVRPKRRTDGEASQANPRERDCVRRR